MSDRWAVTLAVCAALGALRPSALAPVVGGLVVLAAAATRRPALLCVGVALLVSAMGGRALDGLRGVTEGAVVAEVTLLTDPVPTFGGVRADIRLGPRRLELRADGVNADALRPRLAGERITLRGEVQPVAGDAPWLTARHVAGRLRVHAVDSWRPGGLLSRSTNALRRTLERGAESLGAVQRSLYLGVVIGDDRSQPVELADDFLGAGLTHLLAVSGQNVAFAIALVGPLLRRLRLWSRLGVTVAVIGLFGVMTRFEPSVLRAAVMAGLAATLSTVGSPVSRLRVLTLAVTGLLVVDPLLVRSVGFQLSAAATAAIVVIAPRLARVLPGPAALRDAMSVTLAAQVGVAPVLLSTFGPMPVASFPANLLAVPAAGPVMVWGLTGGVVAGWVGGSLATIAHLPTRLLLDWVAGVARRFAALPLGELGVASTLALAVGLAVAVACRARRPGWSRLGLSGAALVLGLAVVAARAPAPLRTELGPGVVRWHASSTDVVVLGGVGGRSPLGAASTLAALREHGVRSVTLLVVADTSVPSSTLAAVASRYRIGTVAVAPGVDAAALQLGARVESIQRPGAVVEVGALEVRITTTADRVVVEARPVSFSAGQHRSIAAVGSAR